MTVHELISTGKFEVLNEGTNTDRKIGSVFCCDLLSVAMSKAPAGCAWVTVMGNMNTLAVSSLTDGAAVIMAEGAVLDDAGLKKAKEQEITVLRSEKPIFDTALEIHEMLNA